MTDTDPARMPPWRFQEWADAEIAKADAAKRAEKPDPSPAPVDPFAGKTDSEIATFWDGYGPNVRTLDQPLSDAHRKRKA